MNQRAKMFSQTALLVALLSGSNALSEELGARVTVFGGGSFLKGERAFIVDRDPFQSKFEKGGKVGLRGTVDLSDHWAVEAAYSFGHNDLRIIELKTRPEERRFEVGLHQFVGNVLYYFTPGDRRLRPFATAGIGLGRFSPSDQAKALALVREFIDDPARIESSDQFGFNIGGGIEGRANRWFGVRFDVRDHIIKIPRFGLPKTPSGPGGIFFPVDGSVHNVEASVGVVFYFR